jgi:prepilin-type N-terminal cleavage/methylation domain-containing protein
MYLLGFFFLARFSFDLPKATLRGFTLVELMVCLGVSAVLVGFALPSVWRWQERVRIDSVRQQLYNDLQASRVRALQWGQRLQMSRLTGCAKFAAPANDWSCGWQVSTISASSSTSQVISTTSLDASVQVTFAKSTDFFISAQGDLGTIGDRWTVLSRAAGLNFGRSLCINSAGRIRWVEAASCS